MRTFSHTEFGDLDLSGVSVVLPERDGTADLLPKFGPLLGKGDAMWRALSAVRHDIVVFVDADPAAIDEHVVSALAGPLLRDPEIQFVKGAYTSAVPEGGRVTELMARPLLRAFYPELGELWQPLAGAFAGRRELFERIPWATGYAAEIALDIDIWREVGVDGIVQVDLGERREPHQPQKSLGRRASTILAAVCARLVEEGRMEPDAAPPVDFTVRPPIRELSRV